MEIPNIKVSEQGVVELEQIEVPLMVNGEEMNIILRKLSTAERNQIRSECAKTKFIGGQPQVNLDERELDEKILAKAIVESPIGNALEDIKKWPSDVTDYLMEAWRNLVEPDDKKKQSLETS